MTRVSLPSSAASAAIISALAAALVAGPAGAQSSAASGAPSGRGSFGGHLQVTEPRGEFGQNTGNGFGVGGYALWRLDPNAIVNLRGNSQDPAFLQAVQQALGLELPVKACSTVANDSVRLVWVGPDDWFVIGQPAQQAALAAALRLALKLISEPRSQ